ncbi:hypothetical protein D3C76_1716740 [compost metagenome]
MEPADAAIAVRQKIGLRQQKGGSTKTDYGLAAPVRTLDDIDQCLLPRPILCKQPADNGNIITIVEFSHGGRRLDHHAGAGGYGVS